ncbi:MAG: 3-deoxy-D-manno-octulosonic acid transferase [Candidatus Omnitrophota bacterium]
MMLDILYLIYLIFSIPFLILRRRWHNGFAMRFGFFKRDLIKELIRKPNIWIHAVSVGEVSAAEEVIRGLRARYPHYRIVFSVTTKAGYALAWQKYSSSALVIWSPLDFSGTVRCFVALIRPLVYVAVETELWPNLFARLGREGVPVVIMNARISDKAYPGYCLARPLIKGMLSRISLVCAQSSLDAERFVKLGVLKDSVKVVGNVKFDVISLPGMAKDAARVNFGFERQHNVLVAGSTHPGEEALIIDIFSELRVKFPQLRVVLAPRHPERAEKVALLVRGKGYVPVFFSGHPGGALAPEEILVMDAIGYLMRLYAAADIVFIGKSLGIPGRGGQNPIEPAACAKPVIVGPFMENFRDVMRLFRVNNALMELRAAGDLSGAIEEMLAHPEKMEGYAARACAVVDQNRGAAARIVSMIAGIEHKRWL